MVEAKKDVKTTVKPAKEAAGPVAAMTEIKPEAAKTEVKAAPVKAEAKGEAVKADAKPEAVKAKAEAVKADGKTETAPEQAKPGTVTAETPALKEAKTVKEAKAPAKKAAAPASRKGTVKKETGKKIVKTPAKTLSDKKQEPVKAEVHFQFDGKDLVAGDVLDRAVKAFKHSHKGVEIKTMELYIVASEGAAYYVVNGGAEDDFKLIL